MASRLGHLAIVQYLCSRPKIDIRCKSNSGVTAVGYAECNGHHEVVKYLRQRGGQSQAKEKH